VSGLFAIRRGLANFVMLVGHHVGRTTACPTTVEPVNGSVVRTEREAARMWRLRRWPNDRTVAHLIYVDHLSTPTPASVSAALDQARRSGALEIRTSALFPRVAEIMYQAGFETIDRLALLRRDLGDAAVSTSTEPGHRTQPFQPWHLSSAVAVDQDAFGPIWGNDVAGLREIRRATPHNRARLVRVDRTIAGFAISGAALDSGYLQRLSVGSAFRRRHIANNLVLDSLQWMRSRGLTAAYVNTGVANAAALSLYQQLGFETLDDELIIAGRRLDG
jgi:ribosomal protein S18 acetylase RimI-like enzyme